MGKRRRNEPARWREDEPSYPEQGFLAAVHPGPARHEEPAPPPAPIPPEVLRQDPQYLEIVFLRGQLTQARTDAEADKVLARLLPLETAWFSARWPTWRRESDRPTPRGVKLHNRGDAA
ncbi:MAG: hypothetical protein RBU30_11910 [Polyangia bacterium]|jgi:hypothetical protein|nr:hypothetical protein [Polyangia bacterium]